MQRALHLLYRGGLERQLQTQLSDSTFTSAGDEADVTIHIAIRILKLGMIKRVKEFPSKFKEDSF